MKKRKAASRPQKPAQRRKAKPATPSRKKAVQPKAAEMSPGAPRRTKIDQLREFLQEAPGGRTRKEIEAKFDWQPHGVRAAISRVDGVIASKVEGTMFYGFQPVHT